MGGTSGYPSLPACPQDAPSPTPTQVRTNAPDRVSVDVAAGVVEPRCTRSVRVFWSDGDKAHAPASATGDVVVVSSRRLPAGTPLPEAASAALLGREVGEAAPDAVLPVVALPRCGDAQGAAARLRAAAAAAGPPAAAAALVRALVDVLYCEGVVNAEGAVLAAGAAALALAEGGGGKAGPPPSTARAIRPVTPDAPPAPITPGASPDGVRASPMEAAGVATADDVADEVRVLFWGGNDFWVVVAHATFTLTPPPLSLSPTQLLTCLDRLTATMHAARCGAPKPAAVGGGSAATTPVAAAPAPAPTTPVEPEPVADRVKFFDSLFWYTA